MAPSDTIVDSRLFVRLDLDVTTKANSAFQTQPENRAHLASKLLLYDRIVIPTKDFGIVPILISWMGLSTFRAALESGALGFVRPPSLLGYAGNGNGISGFTIHPGKQKPFTWWQEAVFGPMEAAPDIQLGHLCPSVGPKERGRIVGTVLNCSKAIDWDNDFFMKHIVHETYTDIQNDAGLIAFVLSREPPGTTKAELPKLSGVTANELRVLHAGPVRDGIDLVLRVADVNLQVVMSFLCGESDVGTSRGAESILKGKLRRLGASPSVLEAFQSLLELNNVPDIGPAVRSGQVTLSDVWRLRQKRVSRDFRHWLRRAGPSDARDLEKAYVEALGQSSACDSLPAKALRFAITNAAGALNLVAGLVTGAADSFFLEKWLKGYSPKLFLDELARLPCKAAHDEAM